LLVDRFLGFVKFFVDEKYYPLIALFFLGLIISGIRPNDYFTWILEVFPAIIGFIVLVFTYRKFKFTYFTYSFILVHCYILLLVDIILMLKFLYLIG